MSHYFVDMGFFYQFFLKEKLENTRAEVLMKVFHGSTISQYDLTFLHTDPFSVMEDSILLNRTKFFDPCKVYHLTET